MAGIKEVAARAGVSIATVSRVFNGHDNIVPEKRQAVRDAAEALGYTANSLAAGLRRKRSNVVGVVLARQGSPFGATLQAAIEGALSDRGYVSMACSTHGETEREQAYMRMLLEMQVGGVIIRPAGTLSASARHAAMLAREGIAVVYVEAAPGRRNESAAMSDNAYGGALAMQTLYAQGHRDIAILIKGWDRKRRAGQLGFMRLEGALSMAEKLGISDRIVLSSDLPLERFDFGQAATKAILNKHPRITAIFATTDMMGMGAIAAARTAGRDVPGDISVLGYDGLAFGEMTLPPMATITQSIGDLGEAAVELLIERLSNPAIGPRQIVLKPSLIARASLGPGPHPVDPNLK